MRLRGLITASFLALLGACRPPEAAPSRDQAMGAAGLAAAAGRPANQQAGFQEGFHLGARMVWEAAARGITPWLPRLGTSGPAVLPEAARRMGVTVEDPGPRVELDAATGFPLLFLDPAGDGFGPGEVAGFAWALAPVQDRLCHPRALPQLPDPKAWLAWRPSGLDLQDRHRGLQVHVDQLGNALLWQWIGNGFPPQRRWRQATAWLAPKAMALEGSALWIATEAHGCLALDLETGLVVRLAEPGTCAPDLAAAQEETLEAAQARQRREALENRPRWLEEAGRGNAEAMASLAWASEDLAERAAWFRKAAEAGDADSMFELAILLYQGRGVPQDRVAARSWFQRAAQAGNARAREALEGLFKAP